MCIWRFYNYHRGTVAMLKPFAVLFYKNNFFCISSSLASIYADIIAKIKTLNIHQIKTVCCCFTFIHFCSVVVEIY